STRARTAALANEGIALLRLGLFAFGAAFPFVGRRRRRLVARATAASGFLGFFGVVAVVERGFAIVPVLTLVAPWALIFALGTAVGDHAKIVISELQVVFGLYPIAVQRGVVRQLPVLFE